MLKKHPTGLKKVSEYARFLPRIRCGCKHAPTGFGTEAIIFLKLTPMVRFRGVPISVNLGIFDSVLGTTNINRFPPLQGNLILFLNVFYKHNEEIRRNTQANKPYRTKEGLRVCKVSAENPVRLQTRTYRVWDRGYYLS